MRIPAAPLVSFRHKPFLNHQVTWCALMHSQAYLEYAIAHSLPITVPGYDRYDCCCMCVQGEGGACSNCGVICTVTQVTAKGALCNSCYQHWRYVFYLILDREEGFCDDFLLVSISGWLFEVSRWFCKGWGIVFFFNKL